MQCPFVILTGASGVGKTSIAQTIESMRPEIRVYQGDTLGLPSQEILLSYGPALGPGGASQRGFALYWIGKIAPSLTSEKAILLETQCRIAFLCEALALHGISSARIILVECTDEVRDTRLVQDRRQPELVNKSMANWSRYLHREALNADCEILDTSARTLKESVAHVLSRLTPSGPDA